MSRPLALVTGARRGIGRAIALELARTGHDLALTDLLDDEALRDAVAACEQAGASAAAFAHDRADVAAHSLLMAAISARFGRLDVVVSNAGIGAPVRGDVLDLTPENFDRVMNVNLRGALFLCQAAARLMLSQKPATPRTFIFVTSVSAEMASPERADYCISKAGLSMFAKNLALRLASENIAVFELRPGIIATDMTAGVTAKYNAAIAGGLVPMRRWGNAEDVARSAAALVSGAFHFSTGTIIHTDGGLSLPKL